jgi:hypothetical protein
MYKKRTKLIAAEQRVTGIFLDGTHLTKQVENVTVRPKAATWLLD